MIGELSFANSSSRFTGAASACLEKESIGTVPYALLKGTSEARIPPVWKALVAKVIL
jgi:hypothetical protein